MTAGGIRLKKRADAPTLTSKGGSTRTVDEVARSGDAPRPGEAVQLDGAVADELLVSLGPDSPAAVLLVNVHTALVLYANPVASQLAPGLALPALVDDWSDAASLRDVHASGDLSDSGHPLSRVMQSLPVVGQAVTAAKATALGAVREPLWVIGLPLTGAPGLHGFALVVFLPLRDRQTLSDAGRAADAAGGGAEELTTGDRPGGPVAGLSVGASEVLLRERAVLATGMAFTVADAQAKDCPLIWVNPAFTSTTGYTEADALGHNCRFLQGPGTDPQRIADMRASMADGKDVTVTLLNYRKDGTAFWNECTLSPIFDAAGVLTHFVGIQSDVTARVAASDQRDRAVVAQLASERELRAERDLSDRLLETMGSLVLVTDPDGTVRRFNHACERLTGYLQCEVLGRRIEEILVPPAERGVVQDRFAQLRAVRHSPTGTPTEHEHSCLGKDGAAHTVRLSHTVLVGADGVARGLLSTGSDVTDRKRTEEELNQQALHDPLTGLANRLLLNERLDSALTRCTRNATRVGVIFLDLDNFKTVNDRLGHAAGDALLIDVAGRLHQCLRDTDTASRLGGDEFVVLAEALTDEHQAHELMGRIRQALRIAVPADGGDIDVTVSIGLAFSAPDSTREELLTRADMAMYQAKRDGRDRFVLAGVPTPRPSLDVPSQAGA